MNFFFNCIESGASIYCLIIITMSFLVWAVLIIAGTRLTQLKSWQQRGYTYLLEWAYTARSCVMWLRWGMIKQSKNSLSFCSLPADMCTAASHKGPCFLRLLVDVRVHARTQHLLHSWRWAGEFFYPTQPYHCMYEKLFIYIWTSFFHLVYLTLKRHHSEMSPWRCYSKPMDQCYLRSCFFPLGRICCALKPGCCTRLENE